MKKNKMVELHFFIPRHEGKFFKKENVADFKRYKTFAIYKICYL